jgi:tRNA dimethylallyltransferase
LTTEIRARGRWPLLVGGTMMYFKALVDGIDEMPPADPDLRTAIDAEAAVSGWPAMHAQLALVDPVTAARLAPNDSQRIQRALEVFRSGGTPLSTLHQRAQRDAPAQDGALLALEPASRAWLHARIAQRFDAMLAAGFLDEVRALRTNPALHLDLPSMRCVGYRQAWEALDAADPPNLSDLRERGVAATRQLAKRQITWLRSMGHRQVVEADAVDVETRLVALVETLIGAPGSAPG